MNVKTLTETLSFAINTKDKSFKVYVDQDAIITIRFDVHGYKCVKAKTTVENIIKLIKGFIYRLEIIHGYRHNDSIKRLLYEESMNNERIIEYYCPKYNPGITNLIIA